MRNLLIATLFVLLTTETVFSQKQIEIAGGCNYFGESIQTSVYSFDSDEEAEAAVQRIMKYTGLPSNFIIRAADVPNAEAVIPRKDNGVIYPQRLILYSQLFMTRVKNMTHTDWAAISILAHEIGHHLSGHTLETTGSRPTIELEADRFSGFILAKMGASLDEALIAINTIASDQGSTTHPGRQSRLAAITNGYKAALEGNITKPTTPSTPTPTNIPANYKVEINYQLSANLKDGFKFFKNYPSVYQVYTPSQGEIVDLSPNYKQSVGGDILNYAEFIWCESERKYYRLYRGGQNPFRGN